MFRSMRRNEHCLLTDIKHCGREKENWDGRNDKLDDAA